MLKLDAAKGTNQRESFFLHCFRVCFQHFAFISTERKIFAEHNIFAVFGTCFAFAAKVNHRSFTRSIQLSSAKETFEVGSYKARVNGPRASFLTDMVFVFNDL